MRQQILKAFLVLAVVGSASAAKATVTISQTVTIGAGNTFSPSTKVGISMTSISTSYTAGSCHLNGTKEYGTVGGSGITGTYADPSKIYSANIPTQATTNTVGVPTTQSSATALTNAGNGTWQ